MSNELKPIVSNRQVYAFTSTVHARKRKEAELAANPKVKPWIDDIASKNEIVAQALKEFGETASDLTQAIEARTICTNKMSRTARDFWAVLQRRTIREGHPKSTLTLFERREARINHYK